LPNTRPLSVGFLLKKITLNSQPIDGNLIPVSKMKKQNDVLVEMG
jgi:hypothetical protein